MTTVTVTPVQAHYLAGLVAEAQKAQQKASDALAILTLGQVPENATLSHIDTDSGVLTFTTPE